MAVSCSGNSVLKKLADVADRLAHAAVVVPTMNSPRRVAGDRPSLTYARRRILVPRCVADPRRVAHKHDRPRSGRRPSVPEVNVVVRSKGDRGDLGQGDL